MVMPQVWADPSRIIGGGGASVFVNPATGAITLTPASGQNVTVASGQLLASTGMAGAPSYSFGSDPDTGIYRSAENELTIAATGAARVIIGSGELRLSSTLPLKFGTDTILERDAANTLAQRNGTNAQISRLYNTDSTDDEYYQAGWSGNVLTLTTVKTGSATLRGMVIGAAAANPLGFYGQTPTVQQVLATGAGATVDNVITALQNLGLVRQAA